MLNKLQATTGYSFWLLPDKYASGIILTLINRLSDSLSSPAFTPHITLSSTPDSVSQNRLKSILEAFAGENHSISVHTNKIVCGDPPFQRYYIALKPQDSFMTFSESMDSLLGGSYARRQNFHASIYYGFNSCEKMEEVYRRLDSEIPDKMYIQSIALVDINGLPDMWKIVHRKDLLS